MEKKIHKQNKTSERLHPAGMQKQPLLFKSESFFEEHWDGMPEFNMTDKTSHRKIIVHFRDDADFAKFCNLINQKLGVKQPSTWFPEMPHRKTSHMTYENE